MDTDAPGPAGPELREYTALLRRRWRLVCAGVLGGVVLAAAAVLGLPSHYTSTAAVQVWPSGMAEFTGEDSGRLSGEVNLDTEAQVLVSDQVSSTVARALARGGPAPATEELRERVEVSVPPNSSVLEISYSDTTPEAARAGAQAYADAYLELRRERIEDLVGTHLEALREEQEERYGELAAATGEGLLAGEARTEALSAQIAGLGEALGPLSALAETVEPGRVITPAGLPQEASRPVPVLWLAGGAALGLLAGLLAAVARDRLDPRLHGAEDTARAGASPVLLDLSGRTERGERSPGLLLDGHRQGQRANEFAHAVRAHLNRVPARDERSRSSAEGSSPPAGAPDAAEEPAEGHVVLVAATTPGRAAGATAVNLAAALARTGSETLLVCAQPRADAVCELLELAEGPGLAEALLEGEDPADLEVRPDIEPRLRVLRYGSPGREAPVQSTAMPELVRLLRGSAEYVVLALAPASERADVHALVGTADLVVPVVETGLTRRTDLTGVLLLAHRSGVAVPGTAVLPRQPLTGPAAGLAPASPEADGAAVAAREPKKAAAGPARGHARAAGGPTGAATGDEGRARTGDAGEAAIGVAEATEAMVAFASAEDTEVRMRPEEGERDGGGLHGHGGDGHVEDARQTAADTVRGVRN